LHNKLFENSLQSIPELKDFLVQLTLKQKYMGERIPEAWLTLEKKVVA